MSDEPSNKGEYSRELSLGESFSKSFDLARKNYLQLLPIFAGFGVLVAVLSTYITYVTPSYNLPTNVASLTQTQLLDAMGSVFRYLEYTAANFLVTWFILYLAAGIGVWKICQLLGKNQKLTFTPTNRINFVNLAITTLLAVAIIEASIIVIIGPLVFGTLLYLSLASSVIEGKSPLASFGRSRNLLSGKWGKTFLLIIGIQIIIYIVALLVSSIVGLLPLSNSTSTLAVSAAQNFILALEFPLVSASMFVLYSSYSQSQVRTMQRPPSLYDNMKPQPMGNFGQIRPQNIAFCPSCGTSVAQDERFCHNCGRALSAP
jgi:hypothetical protein